MARYVRVRDGFCDWCFYDEHRVATKGLELEGQVDWTFCEICAVKFRLGNIPDDEPELQQTFDMSLEEGWE
jgi:hypothetical protein